MTGGRPSTDSTSSCEPALVGRTEKAPRPTCLQAEHMDVFFGIPPPYPPTVLRLARHKSQCGHLVSVMPCSASNIPRYASHNDPKGRPNRFQRINVDLLVCSDSNQTRKTGSCGFGDDAGEAF